jgi:hypothetical protein
MSKVKSSVSAKNAPCAGSSQKKILRSRCFIIDNRGDFNTITVLE